MKQTSYHKGKAAADAAAMELRGQGFKATVSRSGPEWAVTAERDAGPPGTGMKPAELESVYAFLRERVYSRHETSEEANAERKTLPWKTAWSIWVDPETHEVVLSAW